MIRSAASKAAWVGRTASMVFGLALVMALVLGVATTALSATGANFILGKGNTATTPTSLVSTLADAAKSAFIVQNKSGGTALDLRVGNATTPSNAVAPMKVNSNKVVTKLNADTVDGKSDTDFYAAGSQVADSAKLEGKGASEFAAAYKRTVVVSPTGTDVQNGSALLAALTSITDASATKKYLIYIEPGTYDLGTSSLQMKEHVDIQGAGELNTLITGAIENPGCIRPQSGTVRGANNAELRFLTVQNTGAPCPVAIMNNSASPRLTHVTATASGPLEVYGVFNHESSPTMTDVTAAASGGNNTYGVSNEFTSNPTITDASATASGGANSNTGVANLDSSPTMTDVTATASGGTGDKYGVHNFSTVGGNSSPTISQSNLSGSTSSLKHSAGGTAKVAVTQLEGPVSRTFGNLQCFNNYDGNLAPVTCPGPIEP